MRKLGGFLLGSVVGLGVGLIAGSLLLPEDATDDVKKKLAENEKLQDLKEKYEAIYLNKDSAYWNTLADLLNTYCDELGLNYVNYFYHEKLVKEKLNNQ